MSQIKLTFNIPERTICAAAQRQTAHFVFAAQYCEIKPQSERCQPSPYAPLLQSPPLRSQLCLMTRRPALFPGFINPKFEDTLEFKVVSVILRLEGIRTVLVWYSRVQLNQCS